MEHFAKSPPSTSWTLLLGLLLATHAGFAPAAEAKFTDTVAPKITITLDYPGGIVEKVNNETRYYVEARDYKRNEISLTGKLNGARLEWILPKGKAPTVDDIPAAALNLKGKEGEDGVFIIQTLASDKTNSSASATVSVQIRVIGIRHETKATYPNYRGIDQKRLKLGLYEQVNMEMICPSNWSVSWEPEPKSGKLNLINGAASKKRGYEAPEAKSDSDIVTAHISNPMQRDFRLDFKTIAPEKIYTEYKENVESPKNSDHLGGSMNIYFLPDDVNFGRLYSWEGNASFKIAGAGLHYDYYAGKKHSDFLSRIDQPDEAALGTIEGKGTLMAEDKNALGHLFNFSGPDDVSFKALPGWAEIPIPFYYNTQKKLQGGVELGKLTAKIIADVPAGAKDKSNATKTMSKGNPATTGAKPIFEN